MDRRELLCKSASGLALMLAPAALMGEEKPTRRKGSNEDSYDLYVEAAIAHEDGDLSRACDLYSQALKRLPEGQTSKLHAEILENFGKVRRQFRGLQETLASQTAALEREPANPKSRCEFADTLMQVGRTEEAIQEFHKFLALEPERDSDCKSDISKSYAGLARCHYRQGNHQEARRWIEKLHPQGCSSPEELLLAAINGDCEYEGLEYRMLIYPKLGLIREAEATAQFYIRYYGRVGWRYTRALEEVGIDADAMYVQHSLKGDLKDAIA